MTIVQREKVIAGLSCSDVLARLSDYVDGDLDPGDRARIEQHLAGCDGCARFGGEFSATIGALHAHFAGVARVPDHLRERLRRALDADPR